MISTPQVVLKGGVFSMPTLDSREFPLFLYRLVGTWGFAPVPAVWARFLSWYRDAEQKHGTEGLDTMVAVDDLYSSTWLETDIERGKSQSMWMQVPHLFRVSLSLSVSLG
jgi:hypothetical protein